MFENQVTAGILALAFAASTAQAQFVGLAPNTVHFSTAPNTYHDNSVQVTRSFVGMLLGFISVGLFLIFVVVRIVRDELERSAKWDSRVRREEKRLQDSYPVQYGKDSDIKELDYQFNLQELTLEEEVDLKKN
jgi:hypothetical protein